MRGETIIFELKTVYGDDYKFGNTLEDDFRLLKEPSKESVISKGLMNYWIYKNGVKTKTELQHCNSTIESFYKNNYVSSDKAKNADFWKEVYLQENEKKLNEYKNFQTRKHIPKQIGKCLLLTLKIVLSPLRTKNNYCKNGSLILKIRQASNKQFDQEHWYSQTKTANYH